jgi:AcrR family transcriptional regulator
LTNAFFLIKIVINYYFLEIVMPPSERYLPAEKRRLATVKAVLQLAAEQNPNAITTAAIAAQMGLTQGAVFRHFPNKDAILQAVMEWVHEQLMSRIEQAVQAAPGALAGLEAMFTAHVAFVAEHPGVPRILFGELQRPEASPPKLAAQQLVRNYGERLKSLLAEGKARGELDAGIEEEAAAALFLGSIQGLVMQSLLAGDVQRIRREACKVFAIYRRAIRREP